MSATKTALRGAFDEAAVVAAFDAERLVPHRWSNGPHDVYAEHAHGYHKVLYCLRGSIVFRLPGGQDIELRSGDRLDIEPGTRHAAVVGADGVTCIEAARG
jgi:quercetin dioxygenase-like cupin family protein